MNAQTNGEHHEQLGTMEKLFSGRASAAESEQLYAHLKDCKSCEKAYEKLANAESALFPAKQDRALTPFAKERVRDRLFSAAPAPKKAFQWRPMVTLIGSVAVAAGAAFIFMPTSEFTARGGDQSHLNPRVGLRALRVRATGSQVGIEELTQATLAPNDRLQLLATNLDAPYSYVTVLVAGPGGGELARIGPVTLRPGSEDQPLGEPILVEESWPKGELQVIARFTQTAHDTDRDLASETARDGKSDAIRISRITLGASQ